VAVAQSSTTGAQSSPPAAAPRRRIKPLGRAWLSLPPVVFLLALLVFPIALIALYSVNLLTNLVIPTSFSTTNWKDFLPPGDSVFWNRFVSSIVISLIVSVAAVIAAYPVAFYLAFLAHKRRYTLLLVLLAPFFTSYLLRVIAWQTMLSETGTINSILWTLGLRPDGDPVPWLFNSWFAVGLVLFYSWVPFVALPIFVVLENMDRRLLEAAQDLGANRFTTFLRITLPLSMPGVIAAFVFVLIPTTGEFVAPGLVGGSDNYMFGNFIQSFFFQTPDWNYGAVLAVWLMAVVIVLVAASARFLTLDVRGGRA
jgi:spermidine/putrescine transport system permease protein